MTERIGVIGLGRMGSAIARRLSQRGFGVTGYTRSGVSPEKAAEMGIAAASDSAMLAAGSDIILLALLDDEAVHAVLRELSASALAGKLVVDTSTVSPQTLRSHRDAIEAAGAALVDAPISGGPEMVLAGTIGLYIGGGDEEVARFRPIAEALSNRIHHVGGLGDGAAAKLVNNMMLMGLWQSMKEALQLGARAGLSRDRMIDVLSGSPAASPAMKSRLPVVTGQSDAVGFSIDGVIKDATLICDFAAAIGASVPTTQAALASYRHAAAQGFGAADLATMVRLAASE